MPPVASTCPTRGNQRIQVFTADGSHYLTFGTGGNGNYEFSCPAGVAISPANGDIFVVDHCHQRIQVYTSDLGLSDDAGSSWSNRDR